MNEYVIFTDSCCDLTAELADKMGLVVLPLRVDIGDEKLTMPATLEIISEQEAYVVLREGRFHQVKRMIAAAGNKVIYLQRLSVGKLNLDTNLETGSYRELTFEEVELLG